MRHAGILCVSLNPANDVTYRVAELTPGESHRVSSVTTRGGGKAVNVARVIAQSGLAAPNSGGGQGDSVGPVTLAVLADVDPIADFAIPGVELVSLGSKPPRSSVTVVEDSGAATTLNEPGNELDAATWERALSRLSALLAGRAVVVLSGSLPPGAPVEAYAALTRLARDAGAKVIVDTEGESLLAALEAGPTIIKPNEAELLGVTGNSTDPVAAARSLISNAPGTTVVASRGAEGLLSVTAEGGVGCRPGRAVSGNPTGAGDSAVAALAVSLARAVAREDEGVPSADAMDWPAALRLAVGWSGSAVAQPLAGSIDLALAAELSELAEITRLEPAPSTDPVDPQENS